MILCTWAGYIDLEERHEILSYVITAFNERRLAAWRPPLELTSDGFEENAILVKNGLEWFNNEALLIVDNCDYTDPTWLQSVVFLDMLDWEYIRKSNPC